MSWEEAVDLHLVVARRPTEPKKKKHLTYACIEGSFTSIPSMKGRKHLYLYLLFFIWRVWLLSVFLSPIAGVAVALAS